jgi:hypothetical protein
MTAWMRGMLPVLLIVGCAGGAAVAQSPSGSIEGVVLDASGGVLPGVSVTVAQPETGVVRHVVTDDRGVFRAPLLPVGRYEVTALLAAFEPQRRSDLEVTIGGTTSVRLQLGLAAVAEAVTVDATALQHGGIGSSATVGEEAVRQLPVNGRSFLDFALLTPGVTRDARTGDLSFAGQRSTLNALVIDGADSSNTFYGQAFGRPGTGRAPYQFSNDAVREFQVNTHAYAAEYGRAGAGVISVVTKSGTNAHRGSLFEFYRDKALNATNAINELNGLPKSPYHYHQFGGTWGGPIRRHRDFFFANYDGQRSTLPNAVFLNVPRGTPNDPLTETALERLRPLADSWRRALDQDVYFLRTDHQVTGSHRATVRYNHQDFTGVNFERTGPQDAREHTGDTLVRTRTLHASWGALFGARGWNELRVQYARDRLAGTANSADPESIIQQGTTLVLQIGRNNFSPRDNTLDRVQVANTAAWLSGAHTLKTGIDLQVDRIENVFPAFFTGQYTFTSLASFARGRPDGPNESYRQNFAGPGTNGPYTRPDVREYSAFVQDEWRPRSDVTVTLGLRYDLMTMAPPPVRNPDPQLLAAGIDTGHLAPDTNNWGPRVGLAWSPGGRRVVLRGSAGLFYGRTPAIMGTAAHGNNGISVVSLTFTGAAVPTWPQSFAAPPAGGAAGRPNIISFDRRFANPRMVHANTSIDWALDARTSLAVAWLFVDGTDLPRPVDRNIGPPTTRTFTVAGTGERLTYPFFGADRPFGTFDRVVALESTAESRYHGLTTDFQRRLSHGFQVRAAYTLGRVIDTVPEATAVLVGSGDDGRHASNPLDVEVDRTVGNNDQRHRLVVSGIYATDALATRVDGFARALATGWSFSAIVTAQSGYPYSARVPGVDLNGDGNRFNDLAPGTTRNAFRLPAVVTIDPRVTRDIPLGRVRLQLIAEAFNLLDRANINIVSSGFYVVRGLVLEPNPTFGRPIASAGERIVQLAARLTF